MVKVFLIDPVNLVYGLVVKIPCFISVNIGLQRLLKYFIQNGLFYGLLMLQDLLFVLVFDKIHEGWVLNGLDFPEIVALEDLFFAVCGPFFFLGSCNEVFLDLLHLTHDSELVIFAAFAEFHIGHLFRKSTMMARIAWSKPSFLVDSSLAVFFF